MRAKYFLPIFILMLSFLSLRSGWCGETADDLDDLSNPVAETIPTEAVNHVDADTGLTGDYRMPDPHDILEDYELQEETDDLEE